MKDKALLVSVPVLYRKNKKGETEWFLVRQEEDGEWEFPKTVGRRGESSVRAGIRAMAEQGGMQIKVLEEVGRAGGATKINGKPVSQRILYYLMIYLERSEGEGEVLGYLDDAWFPYAKAVRKLTQKRDQQMLREANKMSKRVVENEDGTFERL